MNNLNKAFAMSYILLFASLFSSAQKVEHFVLEEQEEKEQVYVAENLGSTVNTMQVKSGPFVTASGEGYTFLQWTPITPLLNVHRFIQVIFFIRSLKIRWVLGR